MRHDVYASIPGSLYVPVIKLWDVRMTWKECFIQGTFWEKRSEYANRFSV